MLYSDIAWDLGDVVFFSPLDKPESSNNYCHDHDHDHDHYHYYYRIVFIIAIIIINCLLLYAMIGRKKLGPSLGLGLE